MINLENYLKNNTYPGRGVLVGKTEENIVLAYFIMGRSVNSRNRVSFHLKKASAQRHLMKASFLTQASLSMPLSA